ncbi:MAG: DUF3768 domain-containing protein [Chloracidobacterium sp.]
MNSRLHTTLRIRELNDRFRETFSGGRVLITAGIRDLGDTFTNRCAQAVQSFTDFNAGDDPYGEHDFGCVVVDRQKVFWKIDYYDRECRYASNCPADPAQTTRVLTIMLASEY